MRRLLSAILLLLGHSTASAAPREKAALPSAPDKVDFTARLHGELMTKKGNLFYSPTSIRMAMAMAQAGAVGETADEMKKVLGLGDDPAAGIAKLRADWKALADPQMPSWATQSNDPQTQKYAEAELERRRIVLRVVNRLWGQKGRTFNEAFLTNLTDRYGAPLETLDFKSAVEPSRVAINKWVSDQTEKKIEELIPAGTIPADTKLVITNAVYFKGQWSKQFETQATRPEAFHAPDGSKQVPMMHQLDRFRVARIDNGLMLEMPYGEGALAMDIVLPTARDGLAEVEKRFAAGAFDGWLARLEHRRVDVAMPSFKTKVSLELAKVLEAMGMKRAFKYPDADFSGMDGTHELFISKVMHQAFVAVDEKGTEAAAATAVMMEAGAARPTDEPVKFRADHPFMVVIRDTRNGEALFVGRILDPKS
ncbi:MAG: serpin family protein [Myxococcota bacterium]